MKWRIECKFSGTGFDFQGSLDEAIARAKQECSTGDSRHVCWLQPANIRTAEVIQTGAAWIKSKLTADEVVTLMRKHKQTIGGLAFAMGITQKRVRQVRANGLDDPLSVRDWLEWITGEDVGPLPEQYRISRRDEACDCNFCGCPLGRGDTAYEYVNSVYCSITCCRDSRGTADTLAAAIAPAFGMEPTRG